MQPKQELPPIDGDDALQAADGKGITPANSPEISANLTSGQSGTQPVPPNPTVPMVDPTAHTPQSPANQQIQLSDDNIMADDADLIEKEWVDKAKKIVEHTKNDPHQQNLEMYKMKAQYLKKRYNKDLKQNDKQG